MTALGCVRLSRSYALCPSCSSGCFPADSLLGFHADWLTPRALEMACRAGIHDPFRKAEVLLRDLAGWSVDADTLRRRCHRLAALACSDSDADAEACRNDHRTALPEAFAQAEGDFEMHVDAGKVNTVEDRWRDVKVVVFARRRRGEGCDSAGMTQRDLPAASVRSVVAGVETSLEFGDRVEAEALRLKVPLSEGLSVLGDGADWIWTLADDHFHGADQVLDFWHAAEKLACAGRAVLGEGSGEFREWLEEAKRKLAGDGWIGACEALGKLSGRADLGVEAGEKVGEVLNYFATQRERLGYAPRLHRGQAIGSGLVEGTIKQLITVRMKRTGARWRIAHVAPFVEFVALADGPEWRQFWAALAA